MQTFIPFADNALSAKSLDDKRLGKQRSEAYIVLKGTVDPSYGWKSHPATVMWRGYSAALFEYSIAIIDEWRMREKKDTMLETFNDEFAHLRGADRVDPPWLHDPLLHMSHKANLVRKMPSHYLYKFPEILHQDLVGMPYVWPHVPNSDEPDKYVLRLAVADIKRLETGERVLPKHLDFNSKDRVIRLG